MKAQNILIIVLAGFAINLLATTQNNLVYAATAPETITDLVATSGNGFAELTWTAPVDNGAPITSYKLILWETGRDIFTTYPNLAVTTTSTMVRFISLPRCLP